MPTPTSPSRSRHWLLALVVAVTALALPPAPARAAIVTVPPGGSLQAAVNNAGPGDVVRLAGNTAVRDTGGRTGVSHVSVDVVTDLSPPDTIITVAPPNPSVDDTPTFQFTGSDNLTPPSSLTFECRVDTGVYAACSSPFTSAALGDGTHTFQVRATDLAGNSDATPASYTWTVDTTPPAVPVVTSPVNGSATSNPLVSIFGTAEPNSTVTVFIDSASVSGIPVDASGNWTFNPGTPFAQGVYTVRARAEDGAGNVSVASNTITFMVDTLEPDTAFIATPPAAAGNTLATFSFSATDSGSGILRYECSLDGGAFSACSSPRSFFVLGDGSYTFRVRAVDMAGNVEVTPASYTWIVDLTAPDTTITGTPPALSQSSSATFSFSGSDPTSGGVAANVASFQCRIDDGAFSACSSPFTSLSIPDGSHTFEVRAIDGAGNADPTPAAYTWTIDTAPLEVTIEQAASQADPTGVAPVVFQVTFTRPVTGFDGADVDLGASTAPGALAAAVSGSGATYTVSVSGMTGGGTIVASLPQGAAADSVGNLSAASKSIDNRVTFSPTAPVVTGITLADANPSAAASVRFNVSFSEPVTGVGADDFSLVATGVAGASISSVTGSGATYVVAVAAGSGNGSLGLNLSDDDSVRGATSAVPLGGVGAGNGAFTGQAYTIDRAAPAAALRPLAPVVKDGADFTFTVVFSDALAVAGDSLDSADVRVSGPGGFSRLATLTGVALAGDGPRLEASYTVQAPGGAWDAADNGAYQIALEAGQVRDTAGNSVPAGILGAFDVALGMRVYLPVVRSATPPAPLPDLIVERVGVSGGLIQVVIKNRGGTPVTAPF